MSDGSSGEAAVTDPVTEPATAPEPATDPEPATAPAPATDPTARPAIDLRPLFAPRSIAVVGASPRSDIAKVLRDNARIIGSEVPVRFVNPKYEEILGERCYPSLEALPEVPDSVVLAVNPLRAAPIAADAARVGARALIIPGGGVVEGGDAARHMQAEVRRIALEHGIALLGPNCMGLVDWTTRCATYIGDVNPWLPRGPVAAIAQSGSVTDAFIHSGTRIGFSRIVSCGAEVVLDICDYLAHSLDDPETRVVLLFVEGFKRPERFLALADRALELGKPIAVVKVGRSAQAQVAALAHSGSLAGEGPVTDAALDAVGVIRCRDLDELHETAELLAGAHRMGRSVGRGRTGVVTASTGEASLIADLAIETGLDLPTVPETTRERIVEALPSMGYVGNPLDPWGADDPDVAYPACFEAFADSGAIDVLVGVYDFPYRSLPAEVESASSVVRALVEATRERPGILPVYVSLTSNEPTPELLEVMTEGGGGPVLRGAVEAFAAIARVATWEARRAHRLGAGPRRPAWPILADGRIPYGFDRQHAEGVAEVDASEPVSHPEPARRVLAERESLELLREAGLPMVEAIVAAEPAEAAHLAGEMGFPVAVKLDAAGAAHKSDIGGVRLGLGDPYAVRAAAAEVMQAGRAAGLEVRGVLLEPMAEPGLELIAGLKRDPLFGPVVLVGIGGILAEVLADVAIRLAPIDRDEALEMLDALRGAALLRGVRGGRAVARGPVADVLVRLGRLAMERPDIAEIDLNPIIATPDGALAVDGLVVLEDRP